VRPVEHIASRILVVRGQRVIVDADLAALYGVSTKRLNEQVKRNRTRFPEDFVFRLTAAETAEVVANCDDRAIGQILEAIRQLTQPPQTPRRRRIGFL
jgi:hypothetical protein